MTRLRAINPKQIVSVRQRTCIAHRKRLPEAQLLRLVSRREADGSVSVLPDPRRRLPGRGAWITPTIEAWELAHKRRAFGRALKVSTNVDAQPVRVFIEQGFALCDAHGREIDKRKT